MVRFLKSKWKLGGNPYGAKMILPGPARRVLLASLIGSAIEWFDFCLYGTAAALVFNKLFFPAADPLVSLLLSVIAYVIFGMTTDWRRASSFYPSRRVF
jgi:hypothetical protein